MASDPYATATDPGAGRHPSSGFRARLKIELRHHWLLIALSTVYCAIALWVMARHGILGLPVFGEYLVAAFVPLSALIVFRVMGEVAHHVLHVRPFTVRSLGRAVRNSEIFARDRWAAALVPVLIIPLFSGVFTSFKVSIPEIHPFSWDVALMEMDRWLHGGRHPWEWLQPVLGHPAVTSAVSYLYNLWQGMILIVYWQVVRVQDRDLRMRFLLAFLLAWAVLGSAMAYAFSSAGPCFYQDVAAGPNPYAAQMEYLYATHAQYKNWALLAQEYLWRIYQDGQAHLGGGISAMPSLHVAVALLVFLLARSYGRAVYTWLAGGYVVVILVGSVHLAWHYAVDGYVGLLGGWVAWWVAGWAVRRLVPPAPPPLRDAAPSLRPSPPSPR